MFDILIIEIYSTVTIIKTKVLIPQTYVTVTLSVAEEVYSKSVWCALNLISTFLFIFLFVSFLLCILREPDEGFFQKLVLRNRLLKQIASLLILPILFQYCYKYCYSDSRNI